MAAQLIFDLPVRTALGRADFYVSSPNAATVAQLERIDSWPGLRLMLVGPAGSGKSHLTRIWTGETGAAFVSASALSPDTEPGPSGIAVEDADRIAGDRTAETALFHLWNRADARGLPLLITARTSPQGWPFALADTASRLRSMAVARLDPPDDALLAAVLAKLFADRQLAVPPALVPWLVRRMERSFSAARDLVERLDAAALSQSRAVTRALAAEVLDIPAGGPT